MPQIEPLAESPPFPVFSPGAEEVDPVAGPAITAEAAARAAAIMAHLGDGSDAHDASAVSVAAISGLSATDAQGVLAELRAQVLAVESRRVESVTGGGRSVDTGTGIEVRVVDEAIWLPHVALDNGLTLDTAGLNTSDSRAANNAVLAAAATLIRTSPASNNKRVRLPPGTVALDPLRAITGAFILGGASRDRSATTLLFRTSLDATVLGGDCAMDLRDSTVGVENLTISGVAGGSMPVMGINPPEALGTGLRLGHGFANNILIGGFCYPLDIRQDHTRINEVSCTSGWCAGLFGANNGNAADQMIDRLFGSAQMWCGYAVHPTNQISSVKSEQGHFVGVPYGIWGMSASRKQPDYSVGTITVTNGSNAITGSGTAWRANVRNGSQVVVGGIRYYISHIVSDTSILLTQPVTASTASGLSYTITDGKAVTPSFIVGGSMWLDWSFEGIVLAKIGHEGGNGVMADASFKACAASIGAEVGHDLGGRTNDYHVEGLASMSSVEWDDISLSSMLSGLTNIAAIQCDAMKNVNLGEQQAGIDLYRAAGRPYIRPSLGLTPSLSNVRAKYIGAEVRFGRAMAPTLPYDLLTDGGVNVTNSSSGVGNDVKPYATAKADWRGASLGVGLLTKDGIPYHVGDESGMRVNIAGSCVVGADAAIGATTLVTYFTSRLGIAGDAVTLQDSAGVTTATGTITNGTDIAVTALDAAITTGTQLWAARTTGATVGAGQQSKARYGSAGSAAKDVGQIIASGTRWDDAPLVGMPPVADTGRTVIVVPRRGVIAPDPGVIPGGITTTREQMWRPTGALAENVSRVSVPLSNTAVLASGRLNLAGGMVLAGGVTYNSITLCAATTPAGTPINQWFCLIDQATRAVLAKTVDDTTAAWAASAKKTLSFPSGFTPASDVAVYIGCCVVATTVPTLLGFAASAFPSTVLPVISGNSTTGLTDPASLGGTAASPTLGAMFYGYVS